MADFNTKITFTLKDLKKSDIKSSKSTTDKTYFSRLSKEILRIEGCIKREEEMFNDLNSLSPESFEEKWCYEFGQRHETERQEVNRLKNECNDDIIDYINELTELRNKAMSPMPQKEWLLWFAFNGRAVKAFGKVAKDLYDVLSDKKVHNIEGELVYNGSSVKIINFREI